jgi:hypothetical protein
MAKDNVDPDTKKKNLTFLMLMFPSLLLAIIPETINGGVAIALLLKVLVLGFQYVLVQNFIESVYN